MQKTILKNEFDMVFEEISLNGIFSFIDKNGISQLYQNYKNETMNDWSLIWRIYTLAKWKKVWDVNEN